MAVRRLTISSFVRPGKRNTRGRYRAGAARNVELGTSDVELYANIDR